MFADAASHGLIKIPSLHWSPSPVVRNVVVLFKLGFAVGVLIEGDESVSMCSWYFYGWVPCLGPSVFRGWFCWPSILSYQEPTLLICKATRSQCRCFSHGEPIKSICYHHISRVEGNFFGILYTYTRCLDNPTLMLLAIVCLVKFPWYPHNIYISACIHPYLVSESFSMYYPYIQGIPTE